VTVLRPGVTDQGGEPPVTVVNNSGVAVVVAYHYTLNERDQALPVEVTLPPGQEGPFYLAGVAGECRPGRLVAVQGSETVATLERPCPGATWRLVPDGSPSGS
jgi:hypothetical protein